MKFLRTILDRINKIIMSEGYMLFLFALICFNLGFTIAIVLLFP